MFLMMGGIAYAQEFRLASIGDYGSFNGLLAPASATEHVSRGGAGMGFGPFPGIAGKARIPWTRRRTLSGQDARVMTFFKAWA